MPGPLECHAQRVASSEVGTRVNGGLLDGEPLVNLEIDDPKGVSLRPGQARQLAQFLLDTAEAVEKLAADPAKGISTAAWQQKYGKRFPSL